MSRKDYIAIADVLSIRYANCENDNQRYAVRQVAESLADTFGIQNVRFDRGRFLSACGV